LYLYYTILGVQRKALFQLTLERTINLLASGRLNEYLASVDEQAEDMFSRLVKEYADMQGVTEQLKAKNQLLWIQKMNNVWACVRKVVESEIIYF